MPEDERALGRDDERLAATLREVSLTFVTALLLTFFVSFVLFPTPPGTPGILAMVADLVLLLVGLWLVRLGHARTASWMLVFMTWFATTGGIVMAGGLGGPGFSFYIVGVVAAGLLLGPRAALGTALLAAVTSGIVGFLEASGRLPAPLVFYRGQLSFWWIEMVLVAAVASLVIIAVRRLRDALGDAERSEAALARRNEELTRTLLEKQQAEEAASLLQQGLEQAGEAILVLDGQGGIQYANRAAAALRPPLGGAAGDMRRLAAAWGPTFEAEVGEALAAGTAWRGRVFRGGDERSAAILDASLTPVRDARGLVRNFVGVIRDATREAELETHLQQSQKMEALGRLAGGVAHDFNNLLVIIQGHAEVMQPTARGEDAESVAQIREAAQRAAGLTRQLLAFGRRQVRRARVVDPVEVVRAAIPMLRSLAAGGVSLDVQLEEDVGRVRVDPGQLDQVLLNLVANARDAMPQGGVVGVRVANAGPDRVLIAVSDTGSGMDETTRERIFEPFFTTKQEGLGTGLGLAGVYGIVEQCGGSVEVESAPGVGSTFRVFLPRTDAPLEAEEGAAPDPNRQAERAHARVLVVEDENGVRLLVRRALDRAGFEVLEASDGEDALQQLEHETERIDALVTDVMMPRIGGVELAERMRARWPELCVLFISGYAPSDAIERIQSDPRVDFVPKPFAYEQLVGRLSDLLARRDASLGGGA